MYVRAYGGMYVSVYECVYVCKEVCMCECRYVRTYVYERRRETAHAKAQALRLRFTPMRST